MSTADAAAGGGIQGGIDGHPAKPPLRTDRAGTLRAPWPAAARGAGAGARRRPRDDARPAVPGASGAVSAALLALPGRQGGPDCLLTASRRQGRLAIRLGGPVIPPASRPARAPRRPCAYPWTDRGAGSRALPRPAPTFDAGPDDDPDRESGLPSPDLLTVQEWVLAVNASRDLPELVRRLGASMARLGASAVVVFPWDRAAGALAPAPGHPGAAEPASVTALRL